MSYVLAIDVGTSFTAAAIARFDQEASAAPECLPLGLRGTSVPSVIYYPEEGPVLVGEAAERRGLDSPGRVVREFKRRVGDSVPISVGAQSLPAEDVFATMARWVVDRAEEREGAPPAEIVITHPAAWGGHRTSVIVAAMAAKGLANVTLITEPEAAALHYASQVRVDDGSTIAVYDLGGGTFDTAVLRKAAANRFALVGRPEGIENLGGADFDAEVFRYVAEHTGNVLAELDTADAAVLGALARLRRECVEAKEALSADSEASIAVLLPGVQQQVRLVRSEFEALIEGFVRDTVDALEQSLAGMELEPEDLSAVLLIGGSSRIPLVAQLISEQLDRPIAVDADPKSSICLGAAVSAVLAHTATSEIEEPTPAAGAAPAPAGATAVGLPAGAAGHLPDRKASWSRRSATAAGSPPMGAGHRPGHGGAHAPKPTVRLTAIAAAAALFTVLGATAAQGPVGFGNLTSMFVPKAGAAGDASGGSGGTGGGSVGAGAAVAPAAGIEAGVDRKAASVTGPGLEVEASPTSRPSSGATAEKSPAGGGSTGAGAAGSGSTPAGSSGSTGAVGGQGAAGTPTADGTAPGTSTPVNPGTTGPATPNPGTTEPAPTDPGTGSPAPGTGAPVPVDPPPGTVEPAPVDPPPSTVEPAPVDPPPSTVEPAPVEPAPSVTQSEAPQPPAQTVPATDPAAAPGPAA